MKSKVDKLDVNKLLCVPVYLTKLSDVVKYDVVKKTEYNELVRKVNNISFTDTINLVITQKLVKLKTKEMVIIMLNILPHKNLIR